MRRFVSLFLWGLAFEAAVFSGCNDVTVSNTAPLMLNVGSRDEPNGDPVPLKGARLCQTNTENCASTDETGDATIQLPVGEETSFTVVADGHVSYLVPVVMPHPPDTFFMRTDQQMEAQFVQRLMTDYPMEGTGAILATRYDYAAGATFELESKAAVGPFYADEDGWWTFDLTETTKDGRGGFVEIPPGDRHTIRAGGTAEDCSIFWGWRGDDENSYSVPILENHLSLLVLLCLPPVP